MHKILLEEDARPIIYPIADSQWVSTVQVVPKKSEMTIIKNRQDEMNSWRVCINYRKLNQATLKDHFPLPFIDQIHIAYGSTQDHFHMFVWNVRIYKDTVQTLQRPKHFLEIHEQHFLISFGGLHGGFHG
ncbi:hypothetical protein CR513_22094, partial [Mucuna pruriens]